MWLVSTSPVGGNLPFLLKAGEFTIGRSNECEIIVRDSSISRVHARLTISLAGGMHLADLGSRNGTFIGNRRISSLRPNSQNRVRLGAVSLVFRPVPRFDPTQEEDVEESILSEALVRRRKGRQIDSTLTRPQKEVLQLTNQGLSEEEIANLLGRSYHTVHNHLKAIFKHFGVHSKLKLLAKIKEDFE